VKFDIKSGKIVGFVKFDVGNVAMITRGANVGRVGAIVSREKHPGSFDIVHLKDRNDNVFATRLSNVFVIGEGQKPWIALPKKAKGTKLSILEERAEKLAAKSKSKKAAEKKSSSQ